VLSAHVIGIQEVHVPYPKLAVELLLVATVRYRSMGCINGNGGRHGLLLVTKRADNANQGRQVIV